MATKLQTTQQTLQTITNAEIDRANKALNDLEFNQALVVARDASITQLSATITVRDARIRELEALLATPPVVVPPVVPPPVVPPVTGSKTGLYVDGGTLRTKKGTPVVIRGIECMWGPTSAGNVNTVIGLMKGFGANAIGPLFQPQASGATNVRECIAAARSVGMIVGVNADHTGDGRNWICRTDIVDVCNAADNVFLQCEVEQGDDSTGAQWRDASIAFVKRLRDAGHKAPIKVGSPLGGRLPHFALQFGKAVLDSDPQKSVAFTWQSYWKNHTSGWQYANEAGFASGIPGALACCDAIKASGLCFIVGLDGKDDVGETPWKEIAERCQQHGIGWQVWCWMVGDSYGNGLVSDTLSSVPKMPYGPAFKALLTSQSVMPSL